MLKVLEKYILSPVTFKCITIIALFIVQVPFIHIAIGSCIKYILVLGVVACIWDAVKNKFSKFYDKVNVLLVIFVILYGVTIFVNRDLFLVENIKQLVYMAVFFYLFFMIDSKNDIYWDTTIVSFTVVLITFILSFLSFLTYILNIYEWYQTLDGLEWVFIGTSSGRLWGLYNSNVCGTIAMTSIISTLFLAFNSNHKKDIKAIIKYLFLSVNIILQYFVLILSGSRGPYYALLLTLSVIVFVAVIKKSTCNTVLKTVLAFSMAVLMLVMIVSASSFTHNHIHRLIMVSNEDAANIEKDSAYENIIESILVKYFENTSALTGSFGSSVSNSVLGGVGRKESGDLASSSGRTDIWKSGIEVFKTSPIFGVTREGLPTRVECINGELSGAINNGGLHNIYLTILVSSGIVGFIAIAIAVLTVLIEFLKVLFSKQQLDNCMLFSFAMVFAFLISELVENRILYQVTAFNAVFWIYFGYLNFFSKKALGEESNEFSSIKTE